MVKKKELKRKITSILLLPSDSSLAYKKQRCLVAGNGVHCNGRPSHTDAAWCTMRGSMLPSVLITKVKHARAIKVLKLARKEKEKILYIILVEDGEIVWGYGTCPNTGFGSTGFNRTKK